MVIVPLFVNLIVICVLVAELFATSAGMTSADQLLISSALSGLLTALSFKLSKEALRHVDDGQDIANSADKKV